MSFNWISFFEQCGIPRQQGKIYSAAFEKNRITSSLLGDLDKSALIELGVTAIGDQLAILKKIKNSAGSILSSNGSTAEDSMMCHDQHQNSEPSIPERNHRRVYITGPQSSAVSSASEPCVTLASTHRKGRPPPDRMDTYHVKLPTGNTPRTRKILRKAEELRQLGVPLRRDGVRRGGRSLSPPRPRLLTSGVEGPIHPPRKVDGSLSRDISHLGIQGMYSDNRNGSRSVRNVLSRVQRGFITKQPRQSGRVTVIVNERNPVTTRISRQPRRNPRVEYIGEELEVEDQYTGLEEDAEDVELLTTGSIFNRLSFR